MTRAEKIAEARARREAGFFDRQVVERVPAHIHYDHVTLGCGHTVSTFPREDQTMACDTCTDAWVAAELEPQP
jgi:hypothetical protein